MADEWYFSSNGQQFGPIPTEQLKQLAENGQLRPTDSVWKQGLPNWVPATSVPGLFSFKPGPPPLPAPVVFSQQSTSDLIHPSNPPKDPVVMGLLSGCCIAGLGQIVVGQVAKGVVILLGSMVLAVLTAGISVFVTWPVGGIDAYLVAKKLKEGRPIRQWEWF